MKMKYALQSNGLGFRQASRRGGRVVEGAPLLRGMPRHDKSAIPAYFPNTYDNMKIDAIRMFADISRDAILFVFRSQR